MKQNKDVRAMIKSILANHKHAVDLVNSYTDNAEDVMEYIRNWLKSKSIVLEKDNPRSLKFSSQKIKDIFAKHNEPYDIENCYYYIGVNSDVIEAYAEMNTTKTNKVWTNAQNEIKNCLGRTSRGGAWYRVDETYTLISPASERGLSLDDIKSSVEKNLQDFLDNIKVFESKL